MPMASVQYRRKAEGRNTLKKGRKVSPALLCEGRRRRQQREETKKGGITIISDQNSKRQMQALGRGRDERRRKDYPSR
jgi:hypothetical protein